MTDVQTSPPPASPSQPAGPAPLLLARQLRVHFRVKHFGPWRDDDIVRAVDGINFDLRPGETLGIVGESGCGKSSLARALVGLNPVTGGALLYQDRDISGLDHAGWQQMRRDIQLVFQDPLASLNPRMTIGENIAEPLRNLFPEYAAAERQDRVVQALQRVGLSASHINRYPHEFSGGQCQRVGIARALVVEPRVLVCDEAVSALDVSIQSQIIDLLTDLRRDLDLAMIFIAHDLAVVKEISHRIMVMYLGKVMEQGPAESVFGNPRHPYTRALLSAVPVPDPAVERARERVILTGDLPSPSHPPSGCVFRTRCQFADHLCGRDIPNLRQLGRGAAAACHYVGQIADADGLSVPPGLRLD